MGRFRKTPVLILSLAFSLCLADGLYGQGVNSRHFIDPSVIVTIGRPNAWTMEQAHYLLERNRAHDLGIAAKDLGALDANEIVGYRLEALKTLFAAQVQYDAAAGKKNSVALAQYSQDAQRYYRLRARQDLLIEQQATVAGQLSAASARSAELKAQIPPADTSVVQLQQAEVDRLTGRKAAIDQELTALSPTIGSEPSLSLTSTTPTTDATSASAIGQNTTFDTMLKSVPTGLQDSKLQASIKLDNYINLQYEIVAKQLTLLRDEAGPNNRVVFLELPQSIYVAHKLKLYPDFAALWGNHLVQTWWRIEKVLVAEPGPNGAVLDEQPVRPPTKAELFDVSSRSKGQDSVLKDFSDSRVAEPCSADEKQEPGKRMCGPFVQKWANEWVFRVLPSESQKSGAVAEYPAYALDLIPRRSALNIADAHSTSRAYGFAGLFGLLSGLGGKARYERQRDQYSQFAQQEAYASAFGKGQDTFGWTFGPLPGTKRIDPGLRTTYAVVVVPKHTRYIRLQAVGCGYRRRTVPANPFMEPDSGEQCGEAVTYDVEVPSGDDGFYVDEIFYKTTPSGQRITVELAGTFGTQIGVLINGTPLQRVVAIGQPMIEQTTFTVPPNAGDSGVAGVYERIGSRRILLSFVMPASFAGTPTIALVTPGREAVINSYEIVASAAASDPTDAPAAAGAGIVSPAAPHHKKIRLSASDPMFYPAPSVVAVKPVYSNDVTNKNPGTVLAQLFGQGLFTTLSHQLVVNGKVMSLQPDETTPLETDRYRVLSSGVVQVRFDRKSSYPHWRFDFLAYDATHSTYAAATYDDDGPPVISEQGCKVTESKDPKDKKSTVITITVSGEFFGTSYPPAAMDKNISITSSVLASPQTWTIGASVPEGKNWKDAVIQLKGSKAVDSPQFALKSCVLQ